jgi:hypothetical protein
MQNNLPNFIYTPILIFSFSKDFETKFLSNQYVAEIDLKVVFSVDSRNELAKKAEYIYTSEEVYSAI